VVIVHPPEDRQPPPRETVDQFLREALERLSVKDAAAAAAEKFGLPRRDAYERALSLKETS
jgi:16S rRNA (cytidine1402-2'-O)-methyltransferase